MWLTLSYFYDGAFLFKNSVVSSSYTFDRVLYIPLVIYLIRVSYFTVLIGRKCLSLVFGDVVIHELYTAAAGFYLIWLALRLLTLLSNWYPAGWNSVFQKMKTVFTVVSFFFKYFSWFFVSENHCWICQFYLS